MSRPRCVRPDCVLQRTPCPTSAPDGERLRIDGVNGKHVPSGARNGWPKCYLQVVMNGIMLYNGDKSQPEFDINSHYTGNVIGVEFYTVATTSLQFNGTSPTPGKGVECGTVVIWTK